MSNLSEKPPFVKSILDIPPQLEITAIIDYYTRQLPNVVMTIDFTLYGEKHALCVSCIEDAPIFILDPDSASLPLDETHALLRAILVHENICRIEHPERVAVLIDRDQTMERNHE